MPVSASVVKAQETDDGLVLKVHPVEEKDGTSQVILQLKKLIELIDGKEGNANVPSPSWRDSFERLFHSSLQARTQTALALVTTSPDSSSSTELADGSKQDFLKFWEELQERGYDCKVVSTQRYMAGAFDCTFELTNVNDKDKDMIQVHMDFMMRDEQIVFVEQKIEQAKQQSVIIQAVPKAALSKRSSWAFASVSDLGPGPTASQKQKLEDPAVRAAIDNFVALIHLQTGDLQQQEPPQGYEEQFAKVYDKQVHAMLKPIQDLTAESQLEDLDYDALYQRHAKAFSLGYKAEVVRIKPHMKGIVAFTIHMENDASELTNRLVAFMSHETGLFTHLEAQETVFRVKPQPTVVSGQVVADAEIYPIAGYNKTEKDLAEHVLPVSGKLLAGHRSGMAPCQTAGSLIKMYVERPKKFLHLQAFKEERLDVYEQSAGAPSPYANGVHVKEYKRRVVTGKALVLNDGKGKPRALCFQDYLVGGISGVGKNRKSFDVYSTRPLWSGDAPHVQEHGLLGYPWFRMEADRGDHHRTVHVWNGGGYQSMWRVFLGGGKAAKKQEKSGDVPLNEQYPPNKGDVILRTESLDADLAYVTLQENKNTARFNMSIAPGVDPALVLCLAAVLEIMVGLFNSD